MRQPTRLAARAIPLLALALCIASVDEVRPIIPASTADATPVYSSELYLSTPNFPINLTFTPDGRLFYNERCGNVRVITAGGTLLPTPFVSIADVSCAGDHGLTGLELDPDYTTNHYIYVGYVRGFHTVPGGAYEYYQPFIERFTDVNSVGTAPTMIVGNLPTKNHPNVTHGLNNIHFGPDGKLYISVGDYFLNHPEGGDPATGSSQDLTTPIGKLLRVNKEDGSAPPDNPFYNQPPKDPRIFAYGLRNSYDFAFHPENGSIYMTENGPESCDELNLVVAGGNYEWPYGFTGGPAPQPLGLTCEGGVGIPAIHYFPYFDGADPWLDNSTTSPVGILAIDGDQFPALGHSLFICTYRNIVLRHLRLGGPSLDQVTQDIRVIDDNLTACLIDVQISPSGDIFYTQSSSIRRLIIDSDADTVEDKDDNCDLLSNPLQEDYDTDGEGDACDAEDDGDGFDDVAEAEIGTGSLDPCGNDGWPAELSGNDNALNIADFNSFIFPLRGDGSFNKFGHPVPDPDDENIARWDLDANNSVAIGDLNALNPAVLAPTARPPMFGGQPAFFTNNGHCPFPP